MGPQYNVVSKQDPGGPHPPPVLEKTSVALAVFNRAPVSTLAAVILLTR